jgi:FKBP-type peptidyl-prolyl cis-trans isomerase
VEGVSFQPRDVPVGPVSFKLGAGELIPGLEEVLTGMQQGGKRRALIPPEVGYAGLASEPQPPTFATKRQLENHKSEPLLFELQLLKVRSG